MKACDNLRTYFLSSKGRHSKWNCDWSSDVCSSDLLKGPPAMRPSEWSRSWTSLRAAYRKGIAMANKINAEATALRSEERRVGKESRKRRPPDHYKKNTRRHNESLSKRPKTW